MYFKIHYIGKLKNVVIIDILILEIVLVESTRN